MRFLLFVEMSSCKKWGGRCFGFPVLGILCFIWVCERVSFMMKTEPCELYMNTHMFKPNFPSGKLVFDSIGSVYG